MNARVWSKRVGKILGFGLIGLFGLLCAALLAVDLPVARRIAADRVTKLLAGSFRGSISIEHIAALGLSGASGVRARFRDPAGNQVAFFDGVEAQIRTPLLVRSLFRGRGLEIDIVHASVAHADVSLDTAPDGVLRFLHVFDSKEPTPPKPSKESSGGLVLTVEDAALHHAWIHGQMVSAPAIDAEVRDASARVAVNPSALSIDLTRAALVFRALPGGSNAKANATASLTLPSGAKAVIRVGGTLDGSVGDVPVSASGTLNGSALSGHLDVVNAPPLALRALVGVKVVQSATTRWTLGGNLPRLSATGDVQIGTSVAHLSAEANIGSEISGTAHASLQAVDLSGLVEGGPESNLSATLAVTANIPSGGAPHGTFELSTGTGRIGKNSVPVVRARGKFDAKGATAAGSVEEPGVPTAFDVTFRPSQKGGALAVHVSAKSEDLRRMRRVALGLSGTGRVDLDGSVDLGARTVTGRVSGELAGIQSALFAVNHGSVAGSVEGPLFAPRFDVRLTAEDARVDARRFTHVAVTAHGTPAEMRVDAALDGTGGTPRVTAAADVSPGAPLTLRNVHATVGRGTANADLTAKSVQIGSSVRVDDLVVTGMGEPLHADFRLFPGGVSVRSVTNGVDLSKVATLMDLPLRTKSGTLGLDTDVTARGASATGHVRIDLEHGNVDGVQDVETHVDVKVGDRKIEGRVQGRAGGAHFDVSAADVRLGGPLVTARSWRTATGRVDVDANVDLAWLKALLPPGALPLNQVAGTLTVKGNIERKTEAVPEIAVSLHTQGLSVAGLGAQLKDAHGKPVEGAPPWRLRTVDFDGSATVRDGGTLDVKVRAMDPHGDLVRVSAQATVPDALFWIHPEQTTLSDVSTVPFRFSVAIPRRKLSDFPAPLREPGVDGALTMNLDVTNTLRAPKVNLSLNATGLRGIYRRRVTPVDLVVHGSYDGEAADVTADVESEQKTAASVKASVKLSVAALLQRSSSPDWDATVHGEFTKFPISALSAVQDQRLQGFLDGKLDAATGTRTKPSLHAKIDGSALQIGHATYAKGSFAADLDDKKLSGKASLTQTDGFVRAEGGVGVVWRGPLAVGVDTKAAATATLEAHKFRIVALQPFVQDIVDGVDGRLEANVAFQVEGGGRLVSSKGSVDITETKFEFPSFGDEFRNARAKITLSPDGTVRVDDVYAEGVTGKFTANGEARLNGLSLQSAHGTIDIPKREPLPISIEGQTVAEAFGKFQISTSAPPTATHIGLTVDVPSATVRLADKSTHDLQVLSQAPDIQIGVRTKSGDFMLVPTGPPPKEGQAGTPSTMDVLVHIRDVEVQRGTDLRVRLDGDPSIHIADQVSMSGQIRLSDGFLQVEGKRFEIENGTISFEGEPDNPELVVTAAWTAPEGTIVYANFVGPLKTGKVTLSSDPSHSNTEILSLILFGTTDGDTGSQNSDSTAGSAAGVGGGIATQGINKALDDLTGLDITTRIDTSDSANPRPEVEMRVARDITVAIAHVLGVPAPGENPDLNFATLDWRFRRNWSVETTFGDQGSSILDLVWQFRY